MVSPVTRRTLVLLPALDGTGVFFEPLIENLPDWIRPVVVTYPVSGPHQYDALLTHIEGVLAHEAEFYLLGWSFGGPLALMLAQRWPARVKGVILCATFVTPPLRLLPSLRWGIRTHVVGLVRGLWRTRLWLRGVHSDRFRAAKTATWRDVPARALAARGRAIMRVDVRSILRSLEVPALYIAGEHDGVVGPRSLHEIRACNGSVQVARLAGNHYALFTHAEAAAHIACSFISMNDLRPAAGLDTTLSAGPKSS